MMGNRGKICGGIAVLLLTCFQSISADNKSELIYGGDSYTAHASGNKTVVLDWTLNDATSPHVIRCTADSLSDINPTLTWWMLVSHVVSTEPAIVEYVMSQDLNISNAVVDTSNAKDIGITFSHISYDHMGDYFCISTSNDSTTSITNFRIRVSEYRSRGVVASWTIFTILFVGGAFLVCHRFRLNHFSTKIDF